MRCDARPPIRIGSLAGEEVAHLAGRLAAARGIHLFLERVEADSTDHHIAAHDVARRPVEPERVREFEVLLDGGLDLVARHVFFDSRDIESRVLRGGKRARFVRLAAPAEQLLMELEIFLATLILHAHRRRNLRRLNRTLAEDREFLEHKFELFVALEQIEHVGHGTLAIAAIVIEELDYGDITLRIAQRHLTRRSEKGSAVLLDASAMLFRFRRGLPLFELVHNVLQKLGIGQQVFLDDALDVAALIAAEGLRESGGGQRQRQGKQSGNAAAQNEFHCRFSFHQRRKAFGGGLRLARSSALTQPGDPTGKRVLARVAISRAVLMSPRRKAAWADARSARAKSLFWP